MSDAPNSIKLTYFDFHGGRGEPARLALFIGGIPFQDDRVPAKDWPARKPQTPFGSMPVLEVDGRIAAQSNAINRYVGKLAGLYPTDPWQALLCDEAMDVVEEAYQTLNRTFGIQDPEELKKARTALCEGPLRQYLERIAARLAERGGGYFADGKLTVADLKVMGWIRHLRSGVLDHIPKDYVDRVAPLLVEHLKRVRGDARVDAYYRKVNPG